MNLRKMSKGIGGGAGPFFAISKFHLDATRYNIPHQWGIADHCDYYVLTKITSYQRGWVGRLGNLAGRILGRKFDLGRAINRSLEFNQREPPPKTKSTTASDKRPPP